MIDRLRAIAAARKDAGRITDDWHNNLDDAATAAFIVTADRTYEALLAVAEAARELLYIGAVRPFRDAAEDRLGAALDALAAVEEPG